MNYFLFDKKTFVIYWLLNSYNLGMIFAPRLCLINLRLGI